MERVCFELRVRADRLDTCRERPRAVRPEMLAAPPFEGEPSFARLQEVFHLD